MLVAVLVIYVYRMMSFSRCRLVSCLIGLHAAMLGMAQHSLPCHTHTPQFLLTILILVQPRSLKSLSVLAFTCPQTSWSVSDEFDS